MRTSTFITLILSVALAAAAHAAIWAPMTLQELVDKSDVIVVGRLTANGTITVEDALRMPAGARLTEVRLSLPSPSRPVASDVVTYKPGQHGIWFLRRDPAVAGAYLADHPHRLQPVSELTRVRALIR